MRTLFLLVLVACLGACTSNSRDGGTTARTTLGAVSAPIVGPEFGMGQPVFAHLGVSERDQAIASNASGTALVVWSVNHGVSADIYGARVDAAGTILDPEGIPISTAAFGQEFPAVASDGSGWLVAWEEQHNGEGLDVRAARVTSGGSVLDSDGIALPQTDRDDRVPAVAYDGTNFLVAWTTVQSSGNAITAARVNASGNVLDPTGVSVGVAQPVAPGAPPPRASLAFDGTNYVAVWNTLRTQTNTQDIFGSRLSPSLSPVDNFIVSSATGDQTRPSILCRGAGCFVAWEDPAGIRGTRLTTGTTLDLPAIAIATGTGVPLRSPVIATEGTNWLVGWVVANSASSGLVRAARVSSTGSLLDSTPIELGAEGVSIGLAQSATRALAAWGHEPTGNTRGTFVTAAGSTAGATTISVAPRNGTMPAVAASNTNSLVVWLDERHASQTIYGTRVSPSGAILDPSGIQISLPHSFQAWPKVASDGANWLVVWADYRNGTDYDIYGTRVLANGDVPDAEATLIRTAAENQTFPQVSFNGTDWLVSWGSDIPSDHNARRVSVNGAVLGPSTINLTVNDVIAGGAGQWLALGSVNDPVDGNLDVYGQRIAGDGTILDPSPFPVSLTAAERPTGLGASYAAGQWLVVWENNGASTVSGTRIDATGSVVGSGSFPIATGVPAILPEVSFDGANWLVAWWDMRAWVPGFALHVSPPHDIYGARVSTTGAVLDPSGFGISTGVGDETELALSGGASRSLVVYRQSAGPVDEVKARFVGPVPAGGAGGMGGGGGGSGGMAGSVGGNGGVSGTAGADDGGAAGADGGIGGDDGGNAGDGGAAGDGVTGGSSGDAGEAGSSSGGTRPTGGSGGRGGASGGSSAGQAGSGTNPPPDDDDGDCSCRVPGSRPAQRPVWILGFLFGVFAVRRRSLRSVR